MLNAETIKRVLPVGMSYNYIKFLLMFPFDVVNSLLKVKYVAFEIFLFKYLPFVPISLTQKFAGNCPKCPSFGTWQFFVYLIW